MIERRVRFSKDQQDLIKRLLASDEGTGPFKLQVDVLAFAAALAAQRDAWEELPEPTGEPIRQEVFDRQGYDTLINLCAVHKAKTPEVLADTDEMISRRANIFEGYAYAGLRILEQELKGQVDIAQAVMLLTSTRKPSREDSAEAFDVSKLTI